ncbi:Nif3-like dinuclear metal center hexameric protein [Patescibacteria group bacterium]
MVKRDKLIEFINKTLKVKQHKDPWLINGLQVEGKETVSKVVLGVSPSLELFKKAAIWGADMIILHHGMFGPKKGGPIRRVMKERLKALFAADITLLTYHLFLDNHETLGNNSQLIKLLGAERVSPFGEMDKICWGWEGVFSDSISVSELLSRCKKLCGDNVGLFKFGPQKVSRFAVVSGGGPYLLQEAVDKNLDAFLTGEPRESIPAWAKEANIHFFTLGHYNSEKFGIQALGKVIESKFPNLEIKFIDIPNKL